MFCDSPEEALRAPVFPLTWVRCSQCALVQVLQDIPDEVLFERYNYASSTVPGLVQHFAEFARTLERRYSAECSFLEIGCNDGVLLRRLPESWRLVGVDPSDVARRAAQEQRYDFYNRPFTVGLVEDERLEAKFDVVSGSNCLAHISNLKEVFEAAALALREGGHFWIEVHDLDALLGSGQWDTIYHEHKAEWSVESLCRCLAPLGLTMTSIERLSLHGGLLRGCFVKSSKTSPAPSRASPLSPLFKSLNDFYVRRYEATAITELQRASRQSIIAAYGASGRANVFLNQLLALPFGFIVDESPLRAKKYVPRTATPVLGREFLLLSGVSHCLVTAWNYYGDIVAKNPDFKGVWLRAF